MLVGNSNGKKRRHVLGKSTLLRLIHSLWLGWRRGKSGTIKFCRQKGLLTLGTWYLTW